MTWHDMWHVTCAMWNRAVASATVACSRSLYMYVHVCDMYVTCMCNADTVCCHAAEHCCQAAPRLYVCRLSLYTYVICITCMPNCQIHGFMHAMSLSHQVINHQCLSISRVCYCSTEYWVLSTYFVSVLSCQSCPVTLSCHAYVPVSVCLSVCLCILILFFAMSSNCFGVLGDLVTCWCLDALVTLSILFAPSFLLCARYVNGTAGPTHFNFQCLRSKL